MSAHRVLAGVGVGDTDTRVLIGLICPLDARYGAVSIVVGCLLVYCFALL